MKIEELFKKAEKFFSMDEKIKDEKQHTKEKLEVLLDEKIDSLKVKIKEAKSEEKKEELRKKLEVVVDLQTKI